MKDETVHLAAARKFFPGPPSHGTVWRWIRKGVRSGGQQVKLDGTMVGGRLYVKRSAADNFLDRLNNITR